MKKYVFSIGLIPVQEFISEARRSRDLRAGSALLSYFMYNVLHKLKNKLNAELIIPHEKTLKQPGLNFEKIIRDVGYSLPNRASGYCKANDEDELKSVFNSLQQECIQNPWEQLFEECFVDNNYAKTKMGSYYNDFKKAFNNQKECPVQLIWVVQECEDANGHKTNLELIEKLYANIKRTRPIRFWNGKPVGKCDQCGKREAIGPDDYDNWWQWQRKLQQQPWVQTGQRLHPGERLCTVCFAKRFAGYLAGDDFFSTSEVAALTWVQSLQRADRVRIRTKFGKCLSLINNLRGDIEDFGSLLYLRTVRKLIRDKSIKGEKLKKLENCLRELENIIKEEDQLNIKSQPAQYLAVMTFDGDRMGELIRKYADLLPEKIVDFSDAVLEQYPQNDRSIPVRIFYIGGDEGLILMPMEKALPIADEIRQLFKEKVDDVTNSNESITLSVGMTIFDRERPLGGAIRLAHEALEKAKSLDGKNGLSITVQTASGNEFEVTDSWDRDTWSRIETVLKLLNGKMKDCRLSMGWAFEVEAFLQSLPDDFNSWGESGFKEAVIAEIYRITNRKLSISSALPGEKKDKLRKEAWEKWINGKGWINAIPKTEEQFIVWKEGLSKQLHLIAFLSRASFFISEYTQEPIGEGAV